MSFMSAGAANTLRFISLLLATGLIGLPGCWAALALWYQGPTGQLPKALMVALWTGLVIGVLIALWQGRPGAAVAIFVAVFLGLIFWWHGIAPSNDLSWADDVSCICSGTIAGDLVTLRNVRNFEWRTNEDYTQRWETRVYDLTGLNSVDMVISYWSGRAIAHMLVSFGFQDGGHVAFSVEVRRLKNKSYSEIGGFFKNYGLSIIAADERDVIGVRTNVRGEDDYLYRIRMPPSAMRALFVGYVEQASQLVEEPRFYNTITVNCTTLVYHIMKGFVGHLPWSYELLLTGYLPEYVYQVGGLDQRFSLEELRALGRITERAKLSGNSESFSADIRRGIPAIDVQSPHKPATA